MNVSSRESNFERGNFFYARTAFPCWHVYKHARMKLRRETAFLCENLVEV